MATVAYVGGFKIVMFPPAQHQAPYFKVIRGDGRDYSVSITIKDLKIRYLIGIKPHELTDILKWASEHQQELLENWNAVKSGGSITLITGSAPPYPTSLRSLPDLVLEAKFSDGSTKHVDFKKIDLFGALTPLKDQKFFEQVRLEGIFPTWPNGLDLDPDDLWDLGQEPSQIAAST